MLRKVKFRLKRYEFLPDRTPEEEAREEELTKEREGFFHCWTEDLDLSGDIPCVRKKALVEEAETGKIHLIDYDNLFFVKD